MPKYRRMLNDWEAPYIQSLAELIETQSMNTLAEWAVGYSEKKMIPIWIKYFPEDSRPQKALDAARRCLGGEIKLAQAKPAFAECTSAARESDASPAAQAAARAAGQSASVIQNASHSIGLALYGALAAAYDELGTDASWDELEGYAAAECREMLDALQSAAAENEPNPAKISWKC